jgi:exopolyphosphatase/guanosine-5'-triphosphate,3'-diphosphate pyrophosphatase
LGIAEYASIDKMRLVEKVSSKVFLGEETFKTGKVSFATVRELCDLLKGYRRILAEYGVKEYRIFATTAIREAENQQYIIDQINIKTGFSVEVVDMPQEIFYKYIALFRAVESQGLVVDQEGILFVDISSGGLGLTLHESGTIRYQQNIHIGALRIKESFEKYQRESVHFYQALSEYIYSTIEPVEDELSMRKIKYLVLSGAETGLFLKMLGRDAANQIELVSAADFLKLYWRVKQLNVPQLMQAFNLTEDRAEIVLPTIVLYGQILALCHVAEIVVCNVQFGEGITLSHVGGKTNDAWLSVIEDQIISYARTLGEKYHYDPKHASRVEQVALQLFDRLVKVHGLTNRERLLLKIAAILHDVGKFVSLRRHYFYSYRLIISSDIIGFSEEEKALIANIAYYHSKGTPNNTDANLESLSPAQKLTLAKLAAIIRLADSIDRSHKQKATVKDMRLVGERLVITVTADDDISLEEWTFSAKTDFFENVFGIEAILERQAG